MRVRMPKALLSNMGVEKGKTKFDIYLDSRDNSLVFRMPCRWWTGSTTTDRIYRCRDWFSLILPAEPRIRKRTGTRCVNTRNEIRSFPRKISRWWGIFLRMRIPYLTGWRCLSKEISEMLRHRTCISVRRCWRGNAVAYRRTYERAGSGDKIHTRIVKNMMHGYSCMPVFPESKESYQETLRLIDEL